MKAKITFIMTLVCLLTGIDMKAQNNLSNIDVQQQDTVIYVSYDLQHKSDIYLYVSLNNGKTFLGPMNYVSGDVGYNVHSGEKKVVFWYAVSEMGYFSNSNVKFKIVAKSSKDGYLNKADLQYVKVDGEKPFEIGMTEVTVYQYAQFVENTGYKTTAELSGYSYVWNGSSWEKKPGVNWNTDNNGKAVSIADSQSKPVTNLSYKDVVAFCEWAGCRLPSVEEWTIAAKGGESFEYSGSKKANDVAWSYDNAGGKTHNVASKKANAFGIYDMCGNVAEWTSDRNDSEYIFCGGSYYSDPDDCTVYTRSQSTALGSNSLVGFRVVKASSKDMALPVIMIEEDRNDRPSFTEQRGFTTQSGGPAAGNKINGHEYVDLGLPSGTLWATCNVGASRPEDYGYYYSWGETTPGGSHFWDTYEWCNGSAKTFTKYCTKSRRGTVDKKTVLELEDDAAHVNWGGAWRMPTRDEMKELKEKCTWTRTTQGGKNGCRVTGPNGNSIFLPAAGTALSGRIVCDGDHGSYWSSSLCTGCLFGTTDAYDLAFGYWRRHLADVGPYPRYGAHSVRPVCAAGSISAPAVTTSSVSNITQTTAICDGQNKTFTVKGVSFEMVAVKGGTFTMGGTSEQGSDAYDWEKPTHSVTLGDYYIGKFEVTQELWEAVMGSNPSYFKGSKLSVEQVSWDDCQTFIRKLNQLTGANFRLPTEAEWEYAARGGSKSRGYKYSGSNSIGEVAWYDGNSGDKTHPVGTKSPNELGIYDMSGNVWELCQDWYGSYSSGSQTNPQGPSSGSERVYRGGSCYNYAQLCRVSVRGCTAPDFRNNYLGFRLAVSQ